MAMEVEDLTAEELVAGLEKCTFDVLLPLMPRVLELVEKVTKRQEEKALRSEDEEALHKHIFILWYDDLLVNLWPPERFSVGRKVCRQLSIELMRMTDVRFCLTHRTNQIEGPGKILSKLEATVAILAPSSEVGPEMAADKTAKPFGLAVLDILERSLRPSNGRNIFSTLTQLDLTGTMHSGIDDYGAIRLSKASNCYPALKLLKLGNNNISDIGATAIAERLQHLTKLVQIDLSHNYIGYEGAEKLGVAVSNLPSLLRLEIQKNVLADDGAQVIANKLHLCKKLQWLDMSENGMGDTAMRHLAEALHKGSELRSGKLDCHLTHLNLSSSEFWDQGITSLAHSLPRATRLTSLDLSINILGVEGFYQFTKCLPSLISLEHLNLFGTGTDSTGATHLARVLVKMPRLQSLDMSWNDIGPEGAKWVVEALGKISLTSLNLCECNLQPQGAANLANVLAEYTSLSSLNLSDNAIADDGIRDISISLPFVTSLTLLNLSRNSIGAAGSDRLSAVLPECSRLMHLHVQHNVMGSESVISLAAALSNCPALLFVDLSNNGVDGRGIRLAIELHTCANNAKLQLMTNSKLTHENKFNLTNPHPQILRTLLI